MIRFFIVGVIYFLLGGAGVAQESAEYRRGWCDAVKAVMANRDHYRAMVKYPAETHEQSIARIYEKWPPRAPDGFVMRTIVAELVNMEMASIDLYVVLPPQLCVGK